jgi:hypothetical protein
MKMLYKNYKEYKKKINKDQDTLNFSLKNHFRGLLDIEIHLNIQ